VLSKASSPCSHLRGLLFELYSHVAFKTVQAGARTSHAHRGHAHWPGNVYNPMNRTQ